MSGKFKVGDHVRLTGSMWNMRGDGGPEIGDMVTIISLDGDGDGVFHDTDGCAWVVTEDQYGCGELVDDNSLSDFAAKVHQILSDLEAMLISKNQSYGNSALEPLRVFSSVDDTEGIRVRIDDKLSRIAKGSDYGEDAVTDLMGYLVLLKISEGK